MLNTIFKFLKGLFKLCKGIFDFYTLTTMKPKSRPKPASNATPKTTRPQTKPSMANSSTKKPAVMPGKNIYAFPLNVTPVGGISCFMTLDSNNALETVVNGEKHVLAMVLDEYHQQHKFVLYNERNSSRVDLCDVKFAGKAISPLALEAKIKEHIASGKGYPKVKVLLTNYAKQVDIEAVEERNAQGQKIQVLQQVLRHPLKCT